MLERSKIIIAYLFFLLAMGVFPRISGAQISLFDTVSVELSHMCVSDVHGDKIDNVLRDWKKLWLANIINMPDGSPPLTNPKIVLQTALPIIEYWPNAPPILFVEPNQGFYSWNFSGFQISEPEHLPVNIIEKNSVISKPRFSASRIVEPKILTDPVTLQTVKVKFRLEEPLPVETDSLRMGINSHLLAFGGEPLILGEVVQQNTVDGWSVYTDGASAHWYADPSDIVVGKTYLFEAIIKSTKSAELSGNPIFIPTVMIGYMEFENLLPQIGNSITITNPEGAAATFSADNNNVKWNPWFSSSRFELNLDSVISEITSEPYTILLGVYPSTAKLVVGETATVTVSGGVAPYTVQSSDNTIAVALVDGNTVAIKGVSKGVTSITVTDSASDTVNLPVSVKAPSSNIEIFINIDAKDADGEPIDPDIIAHEWLILAPRVGGNDLGVLFFTGDDLVDFDDAYATDPSLSSAALEFDHSASDPLSFGILDLEKELGMASGDVLIYAYAYSLVDINDAIEDMGDIIIANVFIINIP